MCVCVCVYVYFWYMKPLYPFNKPLQNILVDSWTWEDHNKWFDFFNVFKFLLFFFFYFVYHLQEVYFNI